MQAVLLLDVDFVVSHDFGAELATAAGWEDIRQHLEVAPAIVVPAFQAKLGELAWNAKGNVQPERLAWGKQLAYDAVAGGPAAVRWWCLWGGYDLDLARLQVGAPEAGGSCTHVAPV